MNLRQNCVYVIFSGTLLEKSAVKLLAGVGQVDIGAYTIIGTEHS